MSALFLAMQPMFDRDTLSPAALAALNDVLAAFGADGAFSGLSGASGRVHRAVLRRYAEEGQPPDLSSLAHATGLGAEAVAAALRDLSGRDLVVLDAGLIVGMIRLAGHSESGDNAKHNEREEEKGNET